MILNAQQNLNVGNQRLSDAVYPWTGSGRYFMHGCCGTAKVQLNEEKAPEALPGTRRSKHLTRCAPRTRQGGERAEGSAVMGRAATCLVYPP